MDHDDRTLVELSERPIDDVDLAVLQQVRRDYDRVDPMPPDLVDRVRFALALDEMYDEVARMTRVPLDALAVRSEAAPVRTETLTFSADRLTAMVTVVRVGAGRLRLDGWITPPAPMRVGLRMSGHEDRESVADGTGRFSFDGLEEGFGQLTFRSLGEPPDRSADEESGFTVVTPLFQL